MTERECASMFLRAFDDDNISLWVDAVRAWKGSATPIGKAVKSLRSAWYHDGSDDARKKCKRAAERLRNVLRATPDSAPQGGAE